MTNEQMTKEQTAAQRAEEIRELRQGRTPFDGIKSRFLNLPERPGFKTHWFNDENGKIEQKLKEGWTFSERPGFTDSKIDLNKNPRKRIQVRVGTKEDLSDLFAFAMDIPQEIYDGDRREKLKSVDQKEEYMRTGGVADSGGLGFQVTESKIEINKSNFKPD